jgi:hypothetical protein
MGLNSSKPLRPDHVEYQGFEVLVNIATGEVTEGARPRKVASIATKWCLVHQAELKNN